MKNRYLALILVLTVLLTSLFSLIIVSAQDNSDLTISPNYVVYCPNNASGDGRHYDSSSIRRDVVINGVHYNCRFWECSCGATVCTVPDYGNYYFEHTQANYVFKLTWWGGWQQYYEEPTVIYGYPSTFWKEAP